MVDAATTEPRLTIGPTERSIPPVSMTIVSRRRDHRGREPALDELGHRPDGQNAWEQESVDHREHNEDQEQRAEAFVAAPLDRPIESRALTQH